MIPTEITERTQDHPLLSVFLLLFGWVVNTFAELSGEVIWIWIFRAVSLISLVLIILINWRKALSELREILKIKK